MAGKVFHMFAQGRHMDVEDVESIVEVGPQLALGNGLAGIAVGGRQHAHVHVLLGARAQPAQLALLENTQQLGLRAGGHLADLVQQQRAPGSQLEAAGPPLDRAGEGALLMAEDLALDQRFRNGGAVDRDKGPLACAGSARAGCAPPVPCRCRSRR